VLTGTLVKALAILVLVLRKFLAVIHIVLQFRIYQRFCFKKSHSELYVERHDLDMSGMKVGAGIGLAF